MLAAWRLALGLLPLLAIGRQFAIHLQGGFSVVNFFSYFTNLSNLFAALVLLAGAVWAATARPPSARQDMLRYAAVVVMVIVGMLTCLAFPMLYLACVMLRGAAIGWYPYPFLDLSRLGGYAGVVPYAIGIAAAFLLAGWALAAIAPARQLTAVPASTPWP